MDKEELEADMNKKRPPRTKYILKEKMMEI